MAEQSRTLKVIFDGAVSGLRSAAAQAKAAVASINDELGRHQKTLDAASAPAAKLVKSFLAIGAAASTLTSTVSIIGGVASAITTIAPAALLIPGAVLAGAAALTTFKIATAGVGDALKAGLSGDMEKFAEATKDMAPAMQDAVKAVVAFKPQIDSLKKTVQGEFWDDFADQIKQVGSIYLPIMENGLASIARSLGGVAYEALEVTKSEFFQGDVTQILDNTALAIENMSGAVGDALSGFIGLGAVGSTYLPRLGTAIDDVAARFRHWVDEGIETGRIEGFIERAIDGFVQLERIVASAFVGASAAVRAFSEGLGGGEGLSGRILKVVDAFTLFATSVEGQDLFRSLGESIRAVSTAFNDVLFVALKAAGPILKELTPFIVEVAGAISRFLVSAIQIAAPWLERLARFLSENKEVLSTVAPFVLAAAVAFKGLSLALKGVEAVKGAAAVITAAKVAAEGAAAKGPLAAAAMGKLKSAIGGIALITGLAIVADQVDRINLAAVNGDPTKLDTMGSTLHSIVGAGKMLASGDIGGILQQIGDQVNQTNQTWANGQAPIQQWRDTINAKIDEVEAYVNGMPARIGAALGEFGTMLATKATEAWTSFITSTNAKIDEAEASVNAVPGRIVAALGEFGSSLATKASEAWESFKASALAKFDTIDGDARTLPERIGFALGTLTGMLAAKAVEAWTSFKNSAAAKFNEIVADAKALPGKIGAAIAGLVAELARRAVESWQAHRAAATAKGNEILADVRAFPGKVGAAIATLVATLARNAVQSWQAHKAAAIAKGNEIIADARALPGKISAAVVALANLLRTRATEAWNSFRAAAAAKIGEILADVRSLPGRIIGALGNVGGLLVGSGRALMDGFFAGIRSVAASITSFVRGFMAGIRAVFPFSPAKEGPFSGKGYTLYSGQALMADFAKGMEQRTDLVASAARAAALAAAIPLRELDQMTDLGSLSPAGITAKLPATAQQTAAAIAATPAPQVNVTVKIGDTELTGIVDTQVETTNREVARVVGAGAGR